MQHSAESLENQNLTERFSDLFPPAENVIVIPAPWSNYGLGNNDSEYSKASWVFMTPIQSQEVKHLI